MVGYTNLFSFIYPRFRWFNPLKLIISAISTTDLVLPVFAAGLAVCLFAAFKKRQLIVLSTLDLAQMIDLPSAV
ncbi:MAG: hypothetical protein FWB84_02285 [Candidatus Bathyarchaeota archaeon]|uniref:hypothetical protein n=1 Tax=Candidatus Bathycorpusculum sp. TaxID=2994959 RepID=UPI002821EC58|nr:hypothetical protein [Candidatus Termiticorpusculum sp.]MCL2291571.1 hypothetical protein [Candidatus Termiticorpusculum sp.]